MHDSRRCLYQFCDYFATQKPAKPLNLFAFIRIIPAISVIAIIPSTLTAQDEVPAITVRADANLSVAVTRLAIEYSRDANTIVTTSYAPAELQRKAIESGEPADVFISALPSALKELKLQGLTDVYSESIIAKDTLILAGTSPADGVKNIQTKEEMQTFLKDATLWFPIQTGHARDHYTMEALNRLNLGLTLTEQYDRYENAQDLANKLAKPKNYSILYQSELMHYPKAQKQADMSAALYPAIIYSAVVIAGENMEPARGFVKYLKTPKAQRILRKENLVVEEATPQR